MTSSLQFSDDVCDIRFLHKIVLFFDRVDDQKVINEACKIIFRDVSPLFAE